MKTGASHPLSAYMVSLAGLSDGAYLGEYIVC